VPLVDHWSTVLGYERGCRACSGAACRKAEIGVSWLLPSGGRAVRRERLVASSARGASVRGRPLRMSPPTCGNWLLLGDAVDPAAACCERVDA
jgi:hypothetical protein